MALSKLFCRDWELPTALYTGSILAATGTGLMNFKLSRAAFSFGNCLFILGGVKRMLEGDEDIVRTIIRWCSGYFIADTLFCIPPMLKGTVEFGYLLHHVLGLGVLKMCDIYADKAARLVRYWAVYGGLAEVSNLSYFPVYLLIHSGRGHTPLRRKLELFQTVWYTAFRLGAMGWALFHRRPKRHRKLCTAIAILVYIIGMVWSHKLLTSRAAEIKAAGGLLPMLAGKHLLVAKSS